MDYLRDLERAYLTHTYPPMQRVELAEVVGNDFCQPLFLPAGYVRPGSTPLHDLAAATPLTQRERSECVGEQRAAP
jgi:hypothetical protein